MKSIGLGILLALAVWGCAIPPTSGPAPTMTQVQTTPAKTRSGGDQSTVSGLAPLLGLDQATRMGLKRHPRLQVARQEIRAAAGRWQQAGLWENPRLSIEAEELAGEQGGVHGAELTIALSQELPLNGALGLAREAAYKEQQAAQAQYQQACLELQADIFLAFQQVLLSREREQRLRHLWQTTQQASAKLQRMVELGKKPQVDLLQTQVLQNRTHSRLQAARRLSLIARKRLAYLLDIPLAQLPPLEGTLKPVMEVPELHQLEPRLLRHPRLRHLRLLEQALRCKRREYKARNWPNPEITVGARRHYGENANTLLLGLELDLPLLNRHQGDLAELAALSTKIQYEQRVVQQELSNELFAVYQRYLIAREKLQRYERQILPAAERSLKLASQGYSAGKVSVLMETAGQATLIEARLEQLAALEDLYQAMADLQRLGVLPVLNAFKETSE